MKNRHFVVLLGTLALVAVGCQTKVPQQTYYHDPAEFRLASVRHWEDLASDIAAHISQMGLLPSQTSLDASSGQHQITTPDGEIVVFGDVNLKPSEQIPVSIKVSLAEKADNSTFTDLFSKLLTSELIKPEIGFIAPIKNQTEDEGSADYLCKIETHLVRQGSIGGDKSERYEVMLIVSLYANQDKTGRLVATVKQAVYVGSEDLDLYEGHGLASDNVHVKQLK